MNVTLTRLQPVDRVADNLSMRPAIVARVFLALGFLAAPFAYSSWIATRTVFDPAATRSATHALLTAPSVQSTLSRQIHDALEPTLGQATADPKLAAAINAAVADPRFVGAFADAIARIHAGILSDAPGRVTLDTHAVTKALDAAIARHDPAVASRVRASAPVEVKIGSSELPHLDGAEGSVHTFGYAAAAIAVLFVGAALLLDPRRKTFGRVGRRTALLALGPTLVFAVLPRLLDASNGDVQETMAAILHAYARRVMPSAAALAVIGLSIWLIALTLPRRREQHPDEAPSVPASYASRYSARPIRSDEPTTPVPEKLYL